MRNFLLPLLLLAADPRPACARPWPYPGASADPAIELAVAIQMLAEDGVSTDAISFSSTSYAQRMNEYFKPYKDHAAVRLYREVFMEETRAVDFWTMVLEASGGFPKLEHPDKRFTPLLKQMGSFYAETRFMKFFRQERAYYRRCISAFTDQLKEGDYADFLEKYTGMGISTQYRVLISPALSRPTGHLITSGSVTTILGAELGVAEDFPRFSYPVFAGYMMHELAHALLDPFAEAHLDRLAATQACFKPVAGRCRGSWADCVKEHVARAVTLAAGKEIPRGPENHGFFEYLEEEARGSGTPYLSSVSAALKEFEKNRSQYGSFAGFYPKLFSVFEPCPEPSTAEPREPQKMSQEWRYREPLDLARDYLNRREPEKALEILESLTRQFPESAPLWVEQTKAAWMLERKDSALHSLKLAEGAHPDELLLQEIALLYQSMKEFRRSLRLFNELVEKNPRNAAYRKDRGICKYFLGDAGGATQDLEEALRFNPRLISASLALGALYYQQGRRREALSVYDRALSQKNIEDPEEAALIPAIEKDRRQLSALKN